MIKIRKNTFVALVIICIVCFGVQYEAQALKMNIDPPRVELSIPPGGEEGGYVTVLNYDENESIHVKVYVNDVVYLPDGSNDFLPAGSTPWTVADWVKLAPTEFDIAPGEEKNVRYIVEVPEGVEGGRYGVAFFEVSPPLETIEERTTASVNIRLGSIFLITIKGTELYSVGLQDISVGEADEKGHFNISCSLQNGGNVLARPHGPVKIIDSQKTEIATVELNEQESGGLPGTSREFVARYDKDKLPPGEYFVQVVLDYGGEDYIGGQTGFTVK